MIYELKGETLKGGKKIRSEEMIKETKSKGETKAEKQRRKQEEEAYNEYNNKKYKDYKTYKFGGRVVT